MAAPSSTGAAASPSSTKKSQLEFSERDVGSGSHNDGSAATSKNGSSAASPHAPDAGGRPVKLHTPAAEHLRYGHVDYEEVEESEEDKRRHYLLRKPKVKQWFYRGKLFRSAEGRASARIEL